MRKICLFPVMIAVIVFTGCGQKKNEDPGTVTLWHVYGGQTEAKAKGLEKMEQPIIQIKNVTKTFQTRENRVEALKNINLEINKGDIYGIIGMSGAG